MAAAASNGEPQAAASAPGEGEVADSTALASGGSAPLSPTEIGPQRRTWRAAGTPVGGLFQRGSPSPPPKRTKKTGEAGEADEDESVWAYFLCARCLCQTSAGMPALALASWMWLGRIHNLFKDLTLAMRLLFGLGRPMMRSL